MENIQEYQKEKREFYKENKIRVERERIKWLNSDDIRKIDQAQQLYGGQKFWEKKEKPSLDQNPYLDEFKESQKKRKQSAKTVSSNKNENDKFKVELMPEI